jgi:hypothetical protein
MKKKIIGYSLIVISTGLMIGLLIDRNSVAQSCANFWVNPRTGSQECLDSVTNSGSTSGSSGSGPTSPAGVTSGTVSSDSANRQYANRQFSMAPANQIQVRLPQLSRLPQVGIASANTTAGNPGAASASGNLGIAPSAFGTSQVTFTGSRVLGGTTNPAQANPYRVAGKLYMAFGGTTYNYVCSASMIGRSLLITAAHCVHDYGQKSAGWAKKVKFVPAKNDSSEPYGSFESTQFLIPSVYFNGTDTCDPNAVGVVCNNDIALVALNNNSFGQQAGDLTGYYGYGWNNFGFATPTTAFQAVFGNKLLAAITQLGYPASHDSGLKMQLNTSYGGYAVNGNLKNTWLGSAMTGGSSGGPWLVNLGIDASGASYGSSNTRNAVVGVTSWGYTDGSTRVQGSSSFGQNREFPNTSYGTRGAGNIGKLVYDACDNSSIGWSLQSKGRCR